MSEEYPANAANPIAEAAMKRHLEAIRRVVVDPAFAYDSDRLLDQCIAYLAGNCRRVLDIGASSRGRIDFFAPQQVETTDINAGDPPVDIVDDICAPSRLRRDRYDGVICLSVLEHVYDPFAAIKEIHALLRADGYLLLHLPFLFRYHAPVDLGFTDCYRFSRDGLAWMLRDFSEVTLYPQRGPFSSIFNLHRFWKKRVEKALGNRPNRWLDQAGIRLFGRPTSELQVSGYYAWARK